ncbi:uncharacterized protein LOC141679434 [Apium graveolens]|uniref:uncharacterized protein LOC141679434 n=1 Tax=Apium graveolens TaxID=4045 RepID=UPI003D792727
MSLDVADNEVKRILVKNGSSVNVIFEHTLNMMKLGHLRMDPCLEDPLYGFGNLMIPIWGIVYLPVTFGMGPQHVSHIMKFYVISVTSSYNMILGRPTITKLWAIPSTIHLKLKFSTPGEIGEIKGDRDMASRCYGQALVMAEREPENRKKAMTLPKGQSRKKHHAQIQKFVEVKEKTKVEPTAQIIEIELDPGNPSQKLKIGKGLETTFQKELIDLLKEYVDEFAWSPKDMPGIDESVAMHSLDVDPKQNPIKHKRRNFALERHQAIAEEIEKFLKAYVICEIKYSDWLAKWCWSRN